MSRTALGFWDPWKQHWLFLMWLFVLGPLTGFVVSEDHGMLFGTAIAVLASGWLLWSAWERRPNSGGEVGRWGGRAVGRRHQ